MLNEALLLLSLDEIQDVFLHGITIFQVALFYILTYVIYKALGRYIYFKPEEHASKINRTFLAVSLIVVFIHVINIFSIYLPFLPEYRWFYAVCTLVIIFAPLSIISYRLIWKYEHGSRNPRKWHYYYLPLPGDYYKTPVSKSESDGSISRSWEEEVVESTSENIHSDALLNILALVVFIFVSSTWTYESALTYGWLAYLYSGVACLTIAGIYLDHAVFSWIRYTENKVRPLFKKRK